MTVTTATFRLTQVTVERPLAPPVFSIFHLPLGNSQAISYSLVGKGRRLKS